MMDIQLFSSDKTWQGIHIVMCIIHHIKEILTAYMRHTEQGSSKTKIFVFSSLRNNHRTHFHYECLTITNQWFFCIQLQITSPAGWVLIINERVLWDWRDHVSPFLRNENLFHRERRTEGRCTASISHYTNKGTLRKKIKNWKDIYHLSDKWPVTPQQVLLRHWAWTREISFPVFRCLIEVCNLSMAYFCYQ